MYTLRSVWRTTHMGLFVCLFILFLSTKQAVFIVFHEWPILWPRTMLSASESMVYKENAVDSVVELC